MNTREHMNEQFQWKHSDLVNSQLYLQVLWLYMQLFMYLWSVCMQMYIFTFKAYL